MSTDNRVSIWLLLEANKMFKNTKYRTISHKIKDKITDQIHSHKHRRRTVLESCISCGCQTELFFRIDYVFALCIYVFPH